MESNFKEIEEKIKEKQKIVSNQLNSIESVTKKANDIAAINEEDSSKHTNLFDKAQILAAEKEKLKALKSQLAIDKLKKENDKQALHAEARRKADTIQCLKTDIDQRKKDYKKIENERNKMKNDIYERQMASNNISKDYDDVKIRLAKMIASVEGVLCEQKLLADKNVLLEKEDNRVKGELKLHERNIQELEMKLEGLKKNETDALKSVKSLTTLRGNFTFIKKPWLEELLEL